tara:strand:+ start:8176 stop:8853 length:678 start_codon:yes stop_codon:yes gene_type:complete
MSDPVGNQAPVEYLNPEDLIPYEKNAKKHPANQVAALANNIKRFGWNGSPIQIDENGVILAGHGRRLASIKAKLDLVPVVRITHLSEADKKAYRLTDNQVTGTDYDTDLLSIELSELMNSSDIDLESFGFEARDLQFASIDLGEMDIGAMTNDLSGEVESQANNTSSAIEDQDVKIYNLSKAFGFSKVDSNQYRVISRFIKHCEVETGSKGAEALSAYANDFVGI